MEVKIKEPMSLHTSFRVGGEADWFVLPETPAEAAAVIALCKKTGADWFVTGNGSNLLVGDGGYRGVVLCTRRLERLEIAENRILAGAGVLLSRLANKAKESGLSGLEFAAGIPGTVGGAVMMNAGAYGSEMGAVVSQATVMDEDGRIFAMERQELKFGYRRSRISEGGLMVLEAEFDLLSGKPEEIQSRMEELAVRRREKQPLEYPSAGSTFKRPEGRFAGKLIEEAGLKGFSVGGAAVSEKHAGFVINTGKASAADILSVCREVRRRVKEQSGVELELEVRLLGDFGEKEPWREYE